MTTISHPKCTLVTQSVFIVTSPLWVLDPELSWARTLSRFYREIFCHSVVLIGQHNVLKSGNELGVLSRCVRAIHRNEGFHRTDKVPAVLAVLARIHRLIEYNIGDAAPRLMLLLKERDDLLPWAYPATPTLRDVAGKHRSYDEVDIPCLQIAIILRRVPLRL